MRSEIHSRQEEKTFIGYYKGDWDSVLLRVGSVALEDLGGARRLDEKMVRIAGFPTLYMRRVIGSDGARLPVYCGCDEGGDPVEAEES